MDFVTFGGVMNRIRSRTAPDTPMQRHLTSPFLESQNAGVSVSERPSPPLRAQGPYRLRFAETLEQKQAAYRLRFLVFNLELNEGLASAFLDGYDTDEFDQVCDHLIVEHAPTGEVIGTYRLQTGSVAAQNLGYYSEREFEFSPYEHLRTQLVELGRATIHRNHRTFDVLTLLWRGIADYARDHNARYLVGCSSLTSQSSAEGSALYWGLEDLLVEPALRTKPLPGLAIAIGSAPPAATLRPPKLLRAYLSIGARICGAPAIDREFKTIDFLTLLDLEQLSPAARARFLR